MGRISRMFHRGLTASGAVLLAQLGHMLGWLPVCLATGIGCYFSLKWEPGWPLFIWLVLGVLGLVTLARNLPEALSPFVIALALCLIGFILAGVRAHSVAGPVLGWRYYGAVEGRIVAIDRSQSGALRLTLDQLRLDDVPPERTPHRVRISLHGKGPAGITPEPGLRVMITAHLSPPAGPVEPGDLIFNGMHGLRGWGPLAMRARL
ncbi:DUF4131 domain-containing protein [Sulfitobacter pacificus]|uniref:DUF4131 domain-containing protein n=1 Tax=Sulfitobacter pacificus TaxID=1499314 RepID=UPI0036210D64